MSFHEQTTATWNQLRRERYASDPEFRLLTVNRVRARAGLPTLARPEDVPTVQTANRAKAAARQRNGMGRFC